MEDEADAANRAYNEAIYLRGLFVHRYSGIEFAVSELLTRARVLPDYSTFEDLRFKWQSKVKMLRAMLDMPGPLHSYRDDLLGPIDELPLFQVYRDMLVHGLMTARDEGVGIQIKVRSYDHVKGFGLGAASLDMAEADFNLLCDELGSISTAVTGTVARICRDVPLPLLSIEPSIPHPSFPKR